MNNHLMYLQHGAGNMNAKYKSKYKKLKMKIKDLVFENAAICDQVAQIQENILCVKEERRFLLKKLIEHESDLPHMNGILASMDFGGPSGRKQVKKRSNSDASETSNKSKRKMAKKNINTMKRDQSGHPIYPIAIDNFTIYNLGEIIHDNPVYHNEYAIYPVGYLVTRVYSHINSSEKKCMYTCRILSNGDHPKFEIIPESDIKLAISGPSPDYCYSELLKCINSALDISPTDVKPRMGDSFFGLLHPTITDLIQGLPNAKYCTKYNTIKIENGIMENENDHSLNYDALQVPIDIPSYHTVPEIKEEPPDELLELSDTSSFNMT